MTYKNQYAVAVIQNGRIVPEKDGGVVLPYGSEYKIRLKNKSRQKAVADIYLDGSIACKGVVIDEDGTVDLERYIRPGDSLYSGAKFQLAKLSHPGVADANDDQNGLLEVRFYGAVERPKMTVWPPTVIHHYHNNYPPVYVDPMFDPIHFLGPISTCDTSGKMNNPHTLSSSNLKGPLGPVGSQGCCGPIGPTKREAIMRNSVGAPAATVQGSLSGQNFTSVDMDVDTSKFESLTLKLFGVERVIRYDKCPNCNRTRKTSERFCSKCGTQLVLEK